MPDNYVIRNIWDKELTDGTIRNVKEFDWCTEIREDEGNTTYYAS